MGMSSDCCGKKSAAAPTGVCGQRVAGMSGRMQMQTPIARRAARRDKAETGWIIMALLYSSHSDANTGHEFGPSPSPSTGARRENVSRNFRGGNKKLLKEKQISPF